jgi:hypothetical protein
MHDYINILEYFSCFPVTWWRESSKRGLNFKVLYKMEIYLREEDFLQKGGS